MTEIKLPPWDIKKVEREIKKSFKENSETGLLKVLKNNSFLFYELFSRKHGIQPIFREISLGAKLRCDFTWLNDNSDGPEWVLLEIEKPKMKIFSANGKPSSELNNSIEQVKSWQRYFLDYPHEKKRIFGAVARFRYLLVAGDGQSWSTEAALKWRSHNNSTTNIEIRTSDVFLRAIQIIKNEPDEFWSFEEHAETLAFSKLDSYWKNYGYIAQMRQIF